MLVRGPRSKTSAPRGVTLIELMVTLALLGVLLALAAPSLAGLIAANRMATRSNEFVAAVNLARSEAMRRGETVTVRTLGTGGNFSTGWRVTAEDGTVLRELAGTAGNMAFKRVERSGSAGSYTYADAGSSVTDRDYIALNSRGANDSGAAAFFRICDAGNNVQGRILQVSPIGRVSVDSTTEAC